VTCHVPMHPKVARTLSSVDCR